MKDSFNKSLQREVAQAFPGARITSCHKLQSLWSNYGEIVRLSLAGAEVPSIIIKHICPPQEIAHPRGWNTSTSNARKMKSYEVERRWYRDWCDRCDDDCRLPRFLFESASEGGLLIAMEDLDASGFSERRTTVTESEVMACIKWLAEFHATFLEREPEGLWETGTYWHLATRQDELAALTDSSLKAAAVAIDAELSSTKYRTLVHGDAKLANFCFSSTKESVAAVDYQYVGGGCGMKDLAYFVGSCLSETECEERESELLEGYFHALAEALERRKSAYRVSEIEAEWRPLYRVAWADFHRFLKGWSPSHWKLTDYSERVTREVVGQFVD